VDISKTLVYKQPLYRTGQPTSGHVDLGTTTIYVVTLADANQEVVVKFTARYNETANPFCQGIVSTL